MVELKGIGKYFSSNGVQALDRADFDLLPGEIHALVGENGAGKSTLMHIMAGYLKPGAGTVCLDGRERNFRSPADALASGIGMVRQHPSLVPGFAVWEDCILGGEPRAGPFLNRKAARNLVRRLSDRWGFGLPIDRPTDTLTVSLRQKAAILALLLRKAAYLIFDEPTAVLTPGETAGLFALFSQLRSDGKGIVLISHKLEETLSLADRVTVLRKGRTAAVYSAASLDQTALISLISLIGRPGGASLAGSVAPASDSGRSGPGGASLAGSAAPASDGGRSGPGGASLAGSAAPASDGDRSGPEGASLAGCAAPASDGDRSDGDGAAGPPAAALITSRKAPPGPREAPLGLRVEGLRVEAGGRPFIRGVDLELGAGTILGIAGVRDSGPETLELAVAGFLPIREGTIEVNGRDVTGKGPGAFRAAGAAYLGAGIRGSAPALSLRDNLIIHAHRRSARGFWGTFGLMDRAYLDRWIGAVMRTARLPPTPEAASSSFSGGMLQRAALAREFAENADLLVLAEPGWGLDRSSRDALRGELRDYARGGRAVLVFSTDTEELIALADEIRVLRNGFFSGGIVLAPGPRDDPALVRSLTDRIGRLMVGAHG